MAISVMELSEHNSNPLANSVAFNTSIDKIKT